MSDPTAALRVMSNAADTIAALQAEGDRLRSGRAMEAEARRNLPALILAARRAGLPQQETATLSGLSIATVRGIEADAGMPDGRTERYRLARETVGHN